MDAEMDAGRGQGDAGNTDRDREEENDRSGGETKPLLNHRYQCPLTFASDSCSHPVHQPTLLHTLSLSHPSYPSAFVFRTQLLVRVRQLDDRYCISWATIIEDA